MLGPKIFVVCYHCFFLLLGPSQIQADFAAMSLGLQSKVDSTEIKPYETQAPSSSGAQGADAKLSSVVKSSQLVKKSPQLVKKSPQPVKEEVKSSNTNPFEEDSYDPHESKNPFADDLDSEVAEKPLSSEDNSYNPFDEPDDYDKEKNPFGCS